MEICSFKISGPFAHYRKIYGTNTAMSYPLPPRTSLAGLLAGLAGIPKDTYHEYMAPDRLRIGVVSEGNIKRTFHRVNNLSIKNNGDFRGKNGHTQTPIELISGLSLKNDLVSYRVYLAPGNNETITYQRLKAVLMDGSFTFAPCLGAAFCPAFISNVVIHTAETVQHIPAGDEVSLSSAVNREWITRFDMQRMTRVALDEDLYPLFYAENLSRKLGGSIKLMHPTNGQVLPVTLNHEAYALTRDQQTTHLTFLEI